MRGCTLPFPVGPRKKLTKLLLADCYQWGGTVRSQNEMEWNEITILGDKRKKKKTHMQKEKIQG